MAQSNIHPYIPGPGQLVQPFTQFRKSMPSQIDAATLKKLSLAPNNESMVLGVLRFLGFIDQEGKRTEAGKQVFLKHDDTQFAKALEGHVKRAYKALFDLHGDETWNADRNKLIAFFRETDETSGITANRQAIAFETLSALSGHAELAKTRNPNVKSSSVSGSKKTAPSSAAKGGRITDPNPDAGRKMVAVTKSKDSQSTGDFALTVRVEVNLPAQGDQETYDRIFKSIRSNLLNG